jgi:hypothetical protein
MRYGLLTCPMTRHERPRRRCLTSIIGSNASRPKLTLMLLLLGVMLAVMLGGFDAIWAQLVAMSAKLGA